jgi:hypothetical protein
MEFDRSRRPASRGFEALGRRTRFRCERGCSSSILMSEFHLSPNGDHVAFEAQNAQGMSHAWIAPLDRRNPPKQISSSVSMEIALGPGEDIYFWAPKEARNSSTTWGLLRAYRGKVSPQPIQNSQIPRPTVIGCSRATTRLCPSSRGRTCDVPFGIAPSRS